MDLHRGRTEGDVLRRRRGLGRERRCGAGQQQDGVRQAMCEQERIPVTDMAEW
ncbi:MAG TPA: hypothetical protein VFJ50_01035 [Gemmatimonadales bacterium]|nr:hypothetical protein [Gemmatimonadales bacterium]